MDIINGLVDEKLCTLNLFCIQFTDVLSSDEQDEYIIRLNMDMCIRFNHNEQIMMNIFIIIEWELSNDTITLGMKIIKLNHRLIKMLMIFVGELVCMELFLNINMNIIKFRMNGSNSLGDLIKRVEFNIMINRIIPGYIVQIMYDEYFRCLMYLYIICVHNIYKTNEIPILMSAYMELYMISNNELLLAIIIEIKSSEIYIYDEYFRCLMYYVYEIDKICIDPMYN
eukprot:335258_1